MTERRSKYNAKPVESDGIRFDSTAEYRRWQELKLLERAGAIEDLQVHPRFGLLPENYIKESKTRQKWYEADFTYEENGKRVVEDVKGFKTELFKLKWELVKSLYPYIDWRIVK